MADRSSRPTQRLENRELLELTRKSIVADEDAVVAEEDALGEWVEPVVATGSQAQALPTSSRTTTLCDPLTTGLLAEVARRAATVELDPETIEVARRSTREIDRDALEAALRESGTQPVATRRQK